MVLQNFFYVYMIYLLYTYYIIWEYSQNLCKIISFNSGILKFSHISTFHESYDFVLLTKDDQIELCDQVCITQKF
jgi:hypothetical protein